MNYDIEAYEEAVNNWYEELKDIVAIDLLRQHISKYPEKRDFELKEKDDKIGERNEQPTVDK